MAQVAYKLAVIHSTVTSVAGSLDAYCNKHFGYQCMDRILDPECPGLFRQNNVWMASTNKATLCDSRCLKALCQLQEQAKTSVTGEQLHSHFSLGYPLFDSHSQSWCILQVPWVCLAKLNPSRAPTGS